MTLKATQLLIMIQPSGPYIRAISTCGRSGLELNRRLIYNSTLHTHMNYMLRNSMLCDVFPPTYLQVVYNLDDTIEHLEIKHIFLHIQKLTIKQEQHCAMFCTLTRVRIT
jgi:hypothetical protein